MKKKKKVNRNTYHISSIKRLTRKFLEVLRSSRAKQRQSNFFANYDLKNNLRELRFQPWLNQYIKLSFSLFYSSFIFQGIFEESFVESLLDPQFIKNITENTEENNSWETKYGKSVNESLREFLVDNLGKPIHEFFT